MARKQKHEEHENLERWLVSYADFITLLFAFFVVMYSISSINEGKYRVLSDALVAAFRSTPRSMEPVQVGHIAKAPLNAQDQLMQKPAVLSAPMTPPVSLPPVNPLGSEQPVAAPPVTAPPPPGSPGLKGALGDAPKGAGPASLKRIAAAIERDLAPLVKAGLIKVRRHAFWVEVEIKTNILFPSGSAALAAPAIPVLYKLAEILKPFPNAIHVEGFTDNVPINTVAFPSNWELSAARAASVVHLFMKDGMAPHRMAAIGYGQYRPVASNSTPEGRSKNRRVVLVVLAGTDTRTLFDSSTLKDLEPASGPSRHKSEGSGVVPGPVHGPPPGGKGP
ncbi:MAG: hypothetical protein B7Z66_05455 [Chromatiales bacterium 21-64-14]|nr:MAG: hypothetical protein B7Z66_05455 [Chromatiales bacterium 21-64-14]HQU15063.1 flagellar motor protein MotD [Gammaproteobacteria bacterium]